MMECRLHSHPLWSVQKFELLRIKRIHNGLEKSKIFKLILNFTNYPLKFIIKYWGTEVFSIEKD